MSWHRESEQAISQRNADRKDANMRALAVPVRDAHTATMGGSTRGAVPKSEPKRNPALLEMARGRECLLCKPGVCSCTHGSAVACHSNQGIHGKSKGRKADDQYTVWGGDVAHRALDQGPATRAEKEMAFMAAHLRQVLAWRLIATDPGEPSRFRKAALWALKQLGATPLGENP